MDKKILNDKLDEALDQADGELIITVEGMETHLHGDANRAGMLLATHSAIVGMMYQYNMSLDEVIKLVRNVHEILQTDIEP